MALWGMGVMVGPILGPTLGGYLTDVYDWRWVFFINLPFGIIAILGLWFFLEESKIDRAGQFDWTGLSRSPRCRRLAIDARPRRAGRLVRLAGNHHRGSAGRLGLYLFIVHVWLRRDPSSSRACSGTAISAPGLVVMFMVGLVLLSSSALLAPYLQGWAATRW